MKICKELLDAVDSLNREFVGKWADICNIESPTNDKAGVDAVGAYITDFAAAYGWKIEKLPQPLSGDAICITMHPEAKGRPVAISGHLDTVHPHGLFGTPPVRVDWENDTITGPGVTDCKGGVAACMLAMAALDKVGFCARPVIFLLQTDEEVSSKFSKKGTINWMCEKAKDCAAFLNTEGSSKGKACLWRKGISRYHFTVTGKGAHASLCTAGISAVTEAAHKIIELEKNKDADGLTCSCGIIRGGTAENCVPEQCFFTADVRFTDDEMMEKGDRIVTEVAAREYLPGTHCEVTLASRRVAMPKTERNFALLEKMNEIYAAYGMETLEAKGSTGGSDAAEATCAGIPTIDSLGTEGRKIHTQFENSRISSLAESAKRLAVVAYSLEA